MILADATADPARLGRTPIALDVPRSRARIAPLLRPSKDERARRSTRSSPAEEERDREEHWRLLYVAMTRAAERLIVGGVAKARKEGGPAAANCWYRSRRAGDGARRRCRTRRAQVARALSVAATGAGQARAEARELPPVAVPVWAATPAPPESRPPRPLAPSAIAADDESRAAAERGDARRRAARHHGSTSCSSDLPESRRSGARRRPTRWLGDRRALPIAAERDESPTRSAPSLDDPRFAELSADSLAEAPLAATLPDGRVIAGTVDRLLVEDGAGLGGRFQDRAGAGDVARDPACAPRSDGRLYRGAAGDLPGPPVRAALLYTDAARSVRTRRLRGAAPSAHMVVNL